MFYSRCVPILVTQVLAMTSDPENLTRDEYRSALSAQVVLRLLIYCLSHGHGFHIRNYLLKNELISRFLLLMKSKHVFLVLTALKFIRTIVGLKDDVFTRHIVANKLMQPVVNAYLRNGHKYNLLNSALIEFFDFIKSENIKLLILHFGENYMQHFQDVNYVFTFQEIKTRYSQLVEYDKHANSSTVGNSSLLPTDYSDSENASDKSLPFLSPTVDATSSPNAMNPKSWANRNVPGNEYDWLNTEEDDDVAIDDATKQLLGDETPVDEDKWLQQWEFHTNQLQRKRQQSKMTNSSSSVFDSPVLKKSSESGKSASQWSLSIAPIKKFTKTLSASSAASDKIFSFSEDLGDESPPNKNGRADLDDENKAALMLSPILPAARSITPTNSLVDYDSDSDSEDYAADVENCPEECESTDVAIPSKPDESTPSPIETKTEADPTRIGDENSLLEPPDIEEHKPSTDFIEHEPKEEKDVIDDQKEDIAMKSCEDLRLTPKRSRSNTSSPTSEVKSEAEGEPVSKPESSCPPSNGAKEESPPKKRTKSSSDPENN